ncbi:LD-carboxypeptidase [Flavobacterium sp. GA093]|uniref:LD-carboxypeptidase n=1 Tax=Flavobacterium hydrocarbonoxydans TaxID=2683249 RepID=A0A6I4NPL4_9FLAO|nr:LD-carboxypeptidase [Flavobacterium hydrocarbonoxydans]MWB96348.1 LD-carboxypeptidase [Flavobacterium hydrocarbonoxydans]
MNYQENYLSESDKSIKNYTIPPYLKAGDSIMIVAPAGFLSDSTEIDQGVELAKSWGLNVKLGKNLFKKHNHFAGTDPERLEDLQDALDNKNIKAIWCSRGGYGTVRIVDELDFSNFKKNPKWIIGFSDITTLHEHVHRLGFASIHGTMPGGMRRATPEAKETLYKSLFGLELSYEVPANVLNKLGTSKGVLIGGNLSIIMSMLGSNSDIDPKGKILFIEDVGEDLYRVDRMMYTLKRNGFLKDLKGIIVGDFDYNADENILFGGTQREIILNAVKEYDYPVIFDFPAGHIRNNHALTFGKKVKLESNATTAVLSYL